MPAFDLLYKIQPPYRHAMSMFYERIGSNFRPDTLAAFRNRVKNGIAVFCPHFSFCGQRVTYQVLGGGLFANLGCLLRDAVKG